MKFDWRIRGKYILAAIAIGVMAGVASAIFLHTLDFATKTREKSAWLVLLLPLCGVAVSWMYHRFGAHLERGNNLLIDEVHEPKNTVPLRLTPMVLIGTVLTHLFGGSAGREGTAVQMGGSLADQLAKPFKLERKPLLMMGMSAGFGSVFGVPFAGTIFGLEVLTIGKLELGLILECMIASFVGHFICLALQVHHTAYPEPMLATLGVKSVLLMAFAGIFFGLCARLFASSMHTLSALLKKFLPQAPLRAFTAGVVIVVGYYILGTMRFSGLGVPIIVESIRAPIPDFDFFWKLFFTVLTLSSGFRGGEVTPLLFIGATLGNALGNFIALPYSMLAAVGLVAVFAGAANTPWAGAMMAMELFGWRIGAFAVVGCWMSFLFSSSHGIYHAQRSGAGRWLAWFARIKRPVKRFF